MHAIVRGTKVLLAIQPNTPFEFGGIKYPAHWIAHATPKDMKTLGVVPLSHDVYPDTRFFDVSGEQMACDPAEGRAIVRFTTAERPLASVQAAMIAEINDTAAALLSPTDWMVIRAAEEGTPMASDWQGYRRAVREAARGAAAEVVKADDVAAVRRAMAALVWPEVPIL